MAYFNDHSINLISITVEKIISDNSANIGFYYLSSLLTRINFDVSSFVKIGLYVESTSIVVFISSKGKLMQEKFILSSTLAVHNNP